MKRLIIAAAIALAASVVPGAPAGADVEFTQNVQLRQDKGPFNMSYSSFRDGVGSCSDCAAPYKTAGGKMRVHLTTYKLTEQSRRYDYYLVDATVSTRDRHGEEDWGWLEATVRSREAVSYATYSSGKSETREDCGSWPLEIAGSWGPVSVGTTVARFSTCTESWISRDSVKRGQHYHVTNFNGVRNVTFQRFVRVGAGVKPSFRVTIERSTDKCDSHTFPDGTHYWCYNRSDSKSWVIGVQR